MAYKENTQQERIDSVIEDLEKLGVPVRDDKSHGGHFWIDAEANGAKRWVDYYGENRQWGDWRIDDKIHDMLSECGVFAEWLNAGVIVVYTI